MNPEVSPPLLNHEDLRHIAVWAADCAERVLPVFEAKAPKDTRPREALAAIRAFARSGTRTAHLRKVAWAAHAAAREVGDPAAAAAARAASTAAASAYTHPIATPHQVNHILAPAAYGAQATALRANDEAGVSEGGGEAEAEAEVRWAIEQASTAIRQVVQRMPARAPGRGQLAALFYQLDTGLRR